MHNASNDAASARFKPFRVKKLKLIFNIFIFQKFEKKYNGAYGEKLNNFLNGDNFDTQSV